MPGDLPADMPGDLPADTYGKSEIRVTAVDLDEWLKSQPYEPRKVQS
jgi:hypothetical protein